MAGPLVGFGSSVNAATTGPSSQLTGVWCTSSTDCFAVGYSFSTAPFQDKTLVEHWNGKTWTIVPSPNPSGTTDDRLLGVTCASTTNCFAVGTQTAANPSVPKTLIERWDGKTWKVMASPNPPTPGPNSELRAVSCTSGSFCVAVGQYAASKTLIEHWNGKSWSMVATATVPNGGGQALSGVSCTSASFCDAIGGYNPAKGGGFGRGLVENWNGQTWSYVPSTSRLGGDGGFLANVSCASAANCFAVGSEAWEGQSTPDAIVERWNGKVWWLGISVLHPPVSYNDLNGVSCTATTFCMLVGDYWTWQSAPPPYRFSGDRTWAERWDGKNWTIMVNTGPTRPQADLAAVSCTSTTNCFAVGMTAKSTATAGPFTTLTERWNGQAWTTVASPNR
jgi:hypothetical protein